MKITGIKVTEEEVAKAVETYLERFGLRVKVNYVYKQYSHHSEYVVNIEDPTEKVEVTPPPPEKLVETILNPIDAQLPREDEVPF